MSFNFKKCIIYIYPIAKFRDDSYDLWYPRVLFLRQGNRRHLFVVASVWLLLLSISLATLSVIVVLQVIFPVHGIQPTGPTRPADSSFESTLLVSNKSVCQLVQQIN